MALTFQHNSNGIISVYYSYSARDEVDGKTKTKKKYLGHMKDDIFVPTKHKGGKSHRDISEPIEINEDYTTEIENLYLRAELDRTRKLLEQIVALIEPTLKKKASQAVKNHGEFDTENSENSSRVL